MMLSWKIRYLDRADKQFKDRCLHLDTHAVDPVARAAVELATEDVFKTGREILKYRNLFIDGEAPTPAGPRDWESGKSFCVADYFEDETGKQISMDEIAQVISGSPTARSIPAGAKQHDIDLIFGEQKPIPVANVSLTSDESRLLGYFARDLQELFDSALIKDGPGTLCSGVPTPRLETAVSDEEIRSFVTIFRRLYMENEPANFQKAVSVFARALGDHPLGKWAAATAAEFQNHLDAVVDARLAFLPIACTFTTKRLIDVFLYTQYAHQPDQRRQRQYAECVAEVGGNRVHLTWLFLTEIWKCSLEIGNVGRIISGWFAQYCAHYGITPDVLKSLRADHRGLGAAEKEADRRARLFREKNEQLATTLWEQAGRPIGGPHQFLATAQEQLKKRMQKDG